MTVLLCFTTTLGLLFLGTLGLLIKCASDWHNEEQLRRKLEGTVELLRIDLSSELSAHAASLVAHRQERDMLKQQPRSLLTGLLDVAAQEVQELNKKAPLPYNETQLRTLIVERLRPEGRWGHRLAVGPLLEMYNEWWSRDVDGEMLGTVLERFA